MDAATGLISAVAGIGTAGSSGDGVPAVAAQLNTPTAIAFDTKGNMFIAEALGNRIRRCAFCPVEFACKRLSCTALGLDSSLLCCNVCAVQG